MAKKPMDLAEIAKIFATVPSALVTPEQLEAQTEHEATRDQVALEAESVIFYMETRDRDSIFKRRTCQLCGSKFLSTYTGVSLCTNECRKDYFASKGMVWDPTAKTEAERWGGTIPRTIGPTATKMLQGMTFPEEELLPEKSPPVEDDIDAFIASLDDL